MERSFDRNVHRLLFQYIPVRLKDKGGNLSGGDSCVSRSFDTRNTALDRRNNLIDGIRDIMYLFKAGWPIPFSPVNFSTSKLSNGKRVDFDMAISPAVGRLAQKALMTLFET